MSQTSNRIPTIVTQKCGACHATPHPRVLPNYAWPKVLRSMVKIIKEKNLPLNQAEMDYITEFYLLNSPKKLDVIPDDLIESNIGFAKQAIGDLKVHTKPEVTSVKLADIDGDGNKRELLVTDNLNSTVSTITFNPEIKKWQEKTISEEKAPVNTTPMDIDGDGDIDFGVSCMGYMHPNDEMIGEFHLLINNGKGDFTRKEIISGGVPRITDCAPADYDGDGDIDIVLAMFGWRYTGEIAYLEQTAPLVFQRKNIVTINGVMRVIPTHLNSDDRVDFLALITQQHEIVARFINKGNGTFTSDIIAKANHPTFGSSSIYVHDLDQDGDDDILYTNGDMMDENPEPKPYHGVRWLENDNWTYRLHQIASMPGCYDAKPCDMDGDGDIDIVYSALYFQWQANDFPSLAWLENTGEFKTFNKRKIAYSPSNLANIAVGDVNGDGKPDIIGGGMHVPGPPDRAGRITLWLQE